MYAVNKPPRWIAMSFILLQTGPQFMSCAAADAASFQVTNPPAIQKVMPQEGDAGPPATTLRIVMCRGEYEPVQLVVPRAGASFCTSVRSTKARGCTLTANKWPGSTRCTRPSPGPSRFSWT